MPPLDLANRVGSLADAADPMTLYDWIGRRSRDSIVSLLPSNWTFDGRRVLDFGCGAGRTLRHFAGEAAIAEFWGCDIDEPSIGWLGDNLVPPFHVVRTGERPPLPFEDSSFDLIWAVSVFTHLTDAWADWLLELHRLLAGDGLLVVTFMGRGNAGQLGELPWCEARIGMTVFAYDQEWDRGGPMVIHSPWWLRAHFGRAFEVLALQEDGFASDAGSGQGTLLLRKRPVDLTREELERPEPGEPRELWAAQHNLRRALTEVSAMRTQARASEQRAARADHQLAIVSESKSWRLTAPLRLVARKLREARA